MSRVNVFALALLGILASPINAQIVGGRGMPTPERPLILRQSEGVPALNVPALVTAVTLLGSMVHDVASAPGSARRHNEQVVERPPKSPGAAFLFSFGATALPIALGVVSIGADGKVPGVAMISGGALLGPSMGYLYARQWRTGVKGVLLRTVTGLATVALLNASGGLNTGWGEYANSFRSSAGVMR